MDYSAPGTQTESSKPRNPVGGTSDGNKPGSGGQKLAPRDGTDIDPAGAPWSAMPQVRAVCWAAVCNAAAPLLPGISVQVHALKLLCCAHWVTRIVRVRCSDFSSICWAVLARTGVQLGWRSRTGVSLRKGVVHACAG